MVRGFGLIKEGMCIDTPQDYTHKVAWEIVDDEATESVPMSLKSFAGLGFEEAREYAKSRYDITARSKRELFKKYEAALPELTRGSIATGMHETHDDHLSGLKNDVDPQSGLML